jgi:hypothetical protein
MQLMTNYVSICRSKGSVFHCYHCEAGVLEADVPPWETTGSG